MAAKRRPSNDGEQDFGFLDSHNHADSPVSDSIQDEKAEILAEDESVETSMAPPMIQMGGEQQPAATAALQESVDAPVASASPVKTGRPVSEVTNTPDPPTASKQSLPASETPSTTPSADQFSRTLFVGVAGYAIALTLIVLGLLLTGRMSLFGNHALESLPDLRPLAPNEFRKVPEGAELPDGHVMRLGESRRFGDVVVTPVRLTKEPLQFQGFLSGTIEKKLTTTPLLRLWLNFENVADDYAFPPFDAGLMSHRTPADSKDAGTLANSFLTIGIPSGDSASTRRLNFLHSMDSNFVIAGQESAMALRPGELLSTFIVSSVEEGDLNTEESTPYVWRVQFRKGVNVSGGNGVTTLIDVKFSGADIAAAG